MGFKLSLSLSVISQSQGEAISLSFFQFGATIPSQRLPEVKSQGCCDFKGRGFSLLSVILIWSQSANDWKETLNFSIRG